METKMAYELFLVGLPKISGISKVRTPNPLELCRIRADDNYLENS